MSNTIINEYGTKRWYKDGQLHREDGPAIETSYGAKYWYKNGLLHREDGPALEWANDHKRWFLNDEEIKCSSQQEFEKFLRLKAFW